MGRQDSLSGWQAQSAPADAGRSRLPLGTGRVSLYSGSLRQKSHGVTPLPSADSGPGLAEQVNLLVGELVGGSLRLSGMTERPATRIGRP